MGEKPNRLISTATVPDAIVESTSLFSAHIRFVPWPSRSGCTDVSSVASVECLISSFWAKRRRFARRIAADAAHALPERFLDGLGEVITLVELLGFDGAVSGQGHGSERKRFWILDDAMAHLHRKH